MTDEREGWVASGRRGRLAPHRSPRPRARRLLGVVALVLAAVAAGCGEHPTSTSGEAVRPPSGPGARLEDESRESRAPDPRLPPAILGEIRGGGAVTIDDVASIEGAPVEVGSVLAHVGEGSVALELSAGARASLHGEGAMLLAEPPDRGLWIARGVVHVADPPSGMGQRSSRRVATATATIEFVGAGDVVVTVDATGATRVAVLAGAVDVSNGEVDARRRLRVVRVVAGLATRIADRIEEPAPAAAVRLEDALEEALALEGPPDPSASAPPSVPTLAASTARLDEAMRWLEIEEHRGRELTTRHRAAVQAGRSDEAMQRQREIVAHAQAVHALRQIVLARWERFALSARASLAPREREPSVAPRFERLRNLLGS